MLFFGGRVKRGRRTVLQRQLKKEGRIRRMTQKCSTMCHPTVIVSVLEDGQSDEAEREWWL